ncbi:MAG: Iron(III) transport system permease protein [Sphaerisporangium sp.]|jgi:iron(III) transport system permease protein|nr:Iron(III) transport system permease protein [Sphaerisporangium sp.]
MTLLEDSPSSQAPNPAAPPSSPGLLNRLLERRVRGRTVMAIIAVGILAYLVAGPLFILLTSAVRKNDFGLPLSEGSYWTMENVRTVFLSSETYRVLGSTLIFALGSLLLAFVISLSFAWLIERTNIPFRNWLFVLVVAPSGIPLLITAISWSLLLNPTNGVINQVLEGTLHITFNAYSLPGMILVQAFGMVPLTFLLVTGSLRSMNGVLEDAAETSGASRLRIIRRITLPLLTPALLGALIYEFVNSVESVDVPLVLGLPSKIPVLSTTIYNNAHPPDGLPDYGLSGTYGFFLLLLALGPLIAYDRAIGSSGKYATMTGRVRRPKRVDLGRWRVPLFIVAMGYVVVSFILPLLILIWASLQPYYSGVSMAALKRTTLHGWTTVWGGASVPLAIKNTLLLGVVVSILTMCLSVLIAWVIVRARSRFVWILDLLAFMPHAIPGVVIGLSVLLLYLLVPLPIYGSIWIIVIAQVTLYVSLGTRLMGAAIAQLQVVMEEAAAASGAPMRRIWFRVIFPLIRPSFVNGALLVLMASMQNLTLPLMLSSPGNVVLSSLIWDRWDYGLPDQAAVLSVVMVAITVTFAAVLRGGSGKSDVV